MSGGLTRKSALHAGKSASRAVSLRNKPGADSSIRQAWTGSAHISGRSRTLACIVIAAQRYRIEPIEGTPGGYLRIIYFETEQRELERALMFLGSVHLQMLEAFDGVFDGAFRRDVEWVRQREEIDRFGRPLAERFRPEAESGDT